MFPSHSDLETLHHLFVLPLPSQGHTTLIWASGQKAMCSADPDQRAQLFEGWRLLLKSLFGLFQASSVGFAKGGSVDALDACSWLQTPSQASFQVISRADCLEKCAPCPCGQVELFGSNLSLRLGKTPSSECRKHPFQLSPCISCGPCSAVLQAILCSLHGEQGPRASTEHRRAGRTPAPLLSALLSGRCRGWMCPRPPGLHGCSLCNEWTWKRG